MELRFTPGDIVLSGAGYSPGCFVITAVDPSRPKNAYNGLNVINLKPYRLSDDSLGRKIGTATADFLNGGEGEGGTPRAALCFEGGQRRARQSAMFDHTNKAKWEFLANLKTGDPVRVNVGRGVENLIFQFVLAKGEKYVFTAANIRGKHYRYPLSALVGFEVVSKRADALIIADLQDVECALSPENLSCDGERSRTEVMLAQNRLMVRKRVLIRELGREPTELELHPYLAEFPQVVEPVRP